MKIRPEDLFLSATEKLKNNIYYISGNDETYIKRVQSIIVEKLNKKGFVSKKYLEYLSEYKKSSNLFYESEVIVLSNLRGVTEKNIKEVEKNGDTLIISVKNKAGDNALKRLFEKQQNLTLILCYELTREIKAKLLNFYINKKGLNFDKEAYWYLLDMLDNKYVFFEQEILKLALVNNKTINIPLIDKTLSIQENKNFESLFFALLLNNKSIVDIYNSLISTPADFQFFLQRTKFFLEIIVSSKSSKEAGDRFPKYLFKEKENFLKIYKEVTRIRLKKVFNLLYETEKITRKNGNLFRPIGLIFVLRLKKTIFNA